MKLEVREIKNKEIWERFLFQCKEKTFLQSWNWGEFQKREGNKIWRLAIFENNRDLVSVTLIVKIEAKRGSFLFLPHGPIIIENHSSSVDARAEILNRLLKQLRKIAKEENVSFIRVAPIWKKSKENLEFFKKLGFQEAPIHIHPEITWELDLGLPEEDLLMEMRKTTRYLIRKGLKNKDIKVKKSKEIKDIEVFNKLYQATVDRQNFTPFSLDYLKNEFLAFSPDNQIIIFLGKYKKEVISAGIFIFWQNLAFYHHGATILKYPKIPVSYLLQWEATKEAKKRGCKKFNFWGIAPQEERNHPWAGLTLFKKGFGGYEKEYIKTQDLPLSKKYYLTFIFEKLRKIKRGL